MVRLSERCGRPDPNGRDTSTGARAARQIGALLAVLLPVSALLYAPTSIAATPADTAATHTLLQARYTLDVASVDNAAAGQASVRRLTDSLGRECHGVLAGAPRDGGVIQAEGPAPTPRARGEHELQEHQSQTIAEELAAALIAASASPERVAIEAYAAATAPLVWSDSRIAPLVHASAARTLESVTVAPPDVCADMKAWAQSGYRLLSPASKAFELAQAARAGEIGDDRSLEALLKPSEGAAERALLRRATALRQKALAKIGQSLRTFAQLQRALGVPEDPSEERRRTHVLGRGKTLSGATVTVRRESAKEPEGGPCAHSVLVELTERSPKGGIVQGNSSSGPVCLSSRGDRYPSGGCDGSSGELSITAAVAGKVRTVKLRLSDGRTITSAVIHISRKDGGPAGVYVQALRGYKSHPVSLVELDGRGRVVHVARVHLPACNKGRQRASPPPTFVDLVAVAVPGGQKLTIQGALFEPQPGQPEFEAIVLGGIEGVAGARHGILVGRSRMLTQAYPWSLSIGCRPNPFALIYGVLALPGDSVLARTPEGLVPLAKLAIEPSLHSGGPLVYGVFGSLPSELIVRRSDGTTLYSESLVAKAKEDAEFCEGYAEG